MKTYSQYYQRIGRFACCFLPVLIFAIVAKPASGQFFQESFEAPPGATYNLDTPFDDGAFDFFNRYAVPSTLGNRDPFTSGWHGGFGILGGDHDGEPGSQWREVEIYGIPISGRSGLSAVVSLGAYEGTFETADFDWINVRARIDGGTWEIIGFFAPPASGTGRLSQDTDLNGVGDGAQLGYALMDFSFPIPGAGTTLDVEIQLSSTDAVEVLAVDNVRVFSTTTTWDPYYDLALAYYTYFAGIGYWDYAIAYYYLYYGLGEYYYYIAQGQPGYASYYYYYYLGLYGYYIYAGAGDTSTALYYFYYNYALGYYYYYEAVGDLTLAYYYYNALIALALAS